MAKNMRLLLLAAWIAVIGLAAFFAKVSSTIEFTDGLSTAFESDTEQYHRFIKFRDKFGTGSADILVLLDGVDFAGQKNFNKVASFITELQFLDDVTSVVSPLSYTLPNADGSSEYLFPYESISTDKMITRINKLRLNQPSLQNFLSIDRRYLMIAIPFATYPNSNQAQKELIEQIRSLAITNMNDPEVNIAVSGYPVIRTKTVSVLFEEFWFLNAFGGIVGTLVAILAIGSVSLGLITTLSGGMALLWAAGSMTLLGFKVNVITVSLPALILILSFAEAIHLVLEVRRQHLNGHSNPIKNAVRRIFPAAGLAAVTTSVALGSLMFSPSALIYQLGYSGFFAALISTVTVFLIVPLIFSTIATTVGLDRICKATNENRLNTLSLNIFIHWANTYTKRVTIIGMFCFTVSVTLYAQLPLQYSIYEGLKRNSIEMKTISKIENNLSPIGTLQFEHPVDPVDNLKKATEKLQLLVGQNSVYSLASLIKKTGPEFVEEVNNLPDQAKARFLSKDGRDTIITLNYRYEGAEQTRVFVNNLENKIADIPELKNLSSPTGTLTVSSFVTQEMLRAFSRCFIFAIMISGILISIWLRNPFIGIFAMIPNIMPITVVGSFLYLTGNGLSFAAGVALTIAFGIAIDDTVHILNRLRLHANGGQIVPEIILKSVKETSPALVITSLVLILGVSGNLTSEMPPLLTFGALSIGVFLMALVADVLFLPALLITLTRTTPSRFLRLRK